MRTLVRSLLVLCNRSALSIGILSPRPCVSVYPQRTMSSASGESSSGGPGSAAAEVPLALDKSPDNWFAKFSKATDTPKDCFRGYSDRFNGITVDSMLEGKVDGAEESDFGRKLEGMSLFMASDL